MNGVYKTNIGCSLVHEMVENYCPMGRIQPCPTIHRGPSLMSSQYLYTNQCMVEFGLNYDIAN